MQKDEHRNTETLNTKTETLEHRNSRETAVVKTEEGGDDVKSSWPLCPGRHTCYNGVYRGFLDREVAAILKVRLSSD